MPLWVRRLLQRRPLKMSSNLDNLYRQVILDHHKNPRNKGTSTEDGFHSVHMRNPSCGDDITISVKIVDGVIEEVLQEGIGCAISLSSASVMSEILKGKTLAEAKEITENFYEIVKGEDANEDIEMDDAVVFTGVANFPARVRCATLAWKAYEQALKEIEA